MHILKKFNGCRATAYFQANGSITLVRFKEIPVHLTNGFDQVGQDEFFSVQVGGLNATCTSYGVSVIAVLGKIGDSLVEKGIIE